MLPTMVPALSMMLYCGCNIPRQYVFMFLLLLSHLSVFTSPEHRREHPEKEASREVLRFESGSSSVDSRSSFEEGEAVLGACGTFWKLGLPVGLWRLAAWLDPSRSVLCEVNMLPTLLSPDHGLHCVLPTMTDWIFRSPELMSNFPTWHFSC